MRTPRRAGADLRAGGRSIRGAAGRCPRTANPRAPGVGGTTLQRARAGMLPTGGHRCDGARTGRALRARRGGGRARKGRSRTARPPVGTRQQGGSALGVSRAGSGRRRGGPGSARRAVVGRALGGTARGGARTGPAPATRGTLAPSSPPSATGTPDTRRAAAEALGNPGVRTRRRRPCQSRRGPERAHSTRRRRCARQNRRHRRRRQV